MNNLTIAIVGGLVATFGFGLSDFFAKKTIDKIGSVKTLLYTQLVGSFFLITYFLIDSSVPEFSPINVLYLFFFAIFNMVGYLALYQAFEKGKVSVVCPISASYPLLAAIVSFLFFGETFGWLKVMALFLVIVGIILASIDLGDIKKKAGLGALSKGVPEAMVVFVIFGIYNPFWDRFLSTGGWIFWVILIRIILFVLLVIFIKFKKTGMGVSGGSIWIWLLIISLFEAVATFGNTWGLHASVNTTSIVAALTSTYPVVVAIMAYAFLKEKLKVNQYLGMVLILAGVLILPFT